MKIRITQSLYSIKQMRSFRPGQEVEMEEGYAIELLNAGFAEAIQAAVETATIRKMETAIRPVKGRAKKNV